tara:strand:- start:5096 stop:5323 length:228 start_codon:yes stop_codon:yes gene_type:complete
MSGRDSVALHVASAALVLALGTGSILSAVHRPEAPVAGKDHTLIVEGHLEAGGIVVVDSAQALSSSTCSGTLRSQ